MANQIKAGTLHQPNYLRALAIQLRAEADRAEARATRLENGTEQVSCESGCFNLVSTCIKIQPL